MDTLNRLFEILENDQGQSAFGEPQTIGDKVVIPVQRVGGGMGMGWGETPADDSETIPAGGGKGVMRQPVALIEITPQTTRVRPILSWGPLIFAGLATMAWLGFWWSTVLLRLLDTRGSRSCCETAECSEPAVTP